MKRTWTLAGDKKCYICGKKENSKFEDGFNKWTVKSESAIPAENWERSFHTKVRLVELTRDFSNDDTIVFNVCKTCLQVFQLDITTACFRYLFAVPKEGEDFKIECKCDKEKEQIVEEKETQEEVNKLVKEKEKLVEELNKLAESKKETVAEEKEPIVEEKEQVKEEVKEEKVSEDVTVSGTDVSDFSSDNVPAEGIIATDTTTE